MRTHIPLFEVQYKGEARDERKGEAYVLKSAQPGYEIAADNILQLWNAESGGTLAPGVTLAAEPRGTSPFTAALLPSLSLSCLSIPPRTLATALRLLKTFKNVFHMF